MMLQLKRSGRGYDTIICYPDGREVAYILAHHPTTWSDAEKIARDIVKACNCHDELLEALLDAEEALIGHEMNYEETCGRNRSYDQMEAEEAWSETIYKIREAIKKSGGEK